MLLDLAAADLVATGSRTAQFFRLAKPFWRSRAAGRAYGYLLLGLIGVAGTTILVGEMAERQKIFYDAVQARNASTFASSAWMLVLIVALIGLTNVIQMLAKRAAEIHWRTSLTDWLVGRWMRGETAYRIEREQQLDNADQRLTDDVKQLANLTLDLGINFIEQLGLLSVFAVILWSNAGAATFSVFGSNLTVPGYLFWLAIGWGLLVNGISHLAGRKLASLTVQQQKVDADYRFAMAKARSSIEEITLLQGDAVERRRFERLFGPIRGNWWSLLKENLKFTYVSTSFFSLASFIPAIAMAPQLLSGQMSFGTLMQSSSAFMAVSMGIGWFAQSYPQLVQLSAVIRRLETLRIAVSRPPTEGGIAVRTSERSVLESHDLELSKPDGGALVSIPDLKITPQERVLITGPSGIGKSTLLRAIAGMWPHGSGLVELPVDARIMVLPQRAYIPDGPLKEALTYPIAADQISDAVCQDVMRDCLLPGLVDDLHVSDSWSQRLSLGEQQRLGFARMLLHRPDLAFLDESTSSLDEESEQYLYALLLERLPESALISVGHRSTLKQFHSRQIPIGAS